MDGRGEDVDAKASTFCFGCCFARSIALFADADAKLRPLFVFFAKPPIRTTKASHAACSR